MTEETQEKKENDKEYNFRALEEKHKKALEEKDRILQEQQNKLLQLQEEYQNKSRMAAQQDEEDEDDDSPYVDYKKLNKRLNKTKEQLKNESQHEIKSAIQQALEEERKNMWLKENSDFTEVMKHSQALYDKDPELGDTILKMPNTFARQQMVYRYIKSMGLHEADKKQSGIQEKINQNYQNSYYQQSGNPSSPYSHQGDFTPAGQKNAYEKMQELKNSLRL